jgi:Protein of Unknown function (DUF2784)
MNSQMAYGFAADGMLVLHVLFVVFIVFGLVVIFVGKVLSWQWVRNRCFRLIHLIGIGIVVLQSWMGLMCPLTIWEMDLRAQAGEGVYEGSFITHWLSDLLYYHAPDWIFIVCYTGFGVLVVVSWFWVRPRS